MNPGRITRRQDFEGQGSDRECPNALFLNDLQQLGRSAPGMFPRRGRLPFLHRRRGHIEAGHTLGFMHGVRTRGPKPQRMGEVELELQEAVRQIVLRACAKHDS